MELLVRESGDGESSTPRETQRGADVNVNKSPALRAVVG